MKKIQLLMLLISSLVLTGCEKTVVESQSIKSYTIIEIKRPKHFRVSLKDKDGRVFKNVGVSKHCNRWKEVQLGTVVELNTKILKRGDERWQEMETRSICPGN